MLPLPRSLGFQPRKGAPTYLLFLILFIYFCVCVPGSQPRKPHPSATHRPGIQDLTPAKTPIRRLLATFRTSGPFGLSDQRGRRLRVGGGQEGARAQPVTSSSTCHLEPGSSWVPLGPWEREASWGMVFVAPGIRPAPPSPASGRNRFFLPLLSRGSGFYQHTF